MRYELLRRQQERLRQAQPPPAVQQQQHPGAAPGVALRPSPPSYPHTVAAQHGAGAQTLPHGQPSAFSPEQLVPVCYSCVPLPGWFRAYTLVYSWLVLCVHLYVYHGRDIFWLCDVALRVLRVGKNHSCACARYFSDAHMCTCELTGGRRGACCGDAHAAARRTAQHGSAASRISGPWAEFPTARRAVTFPERQRSRSAARLPGAQSAGASLPSPSTGDKLGARTALGGTTTGWRAHWAPRVPAPGAPGAPGASTNFAAKPPRGSSAGLRPTRSLPGSRTCRHGWVLTCCGVRSSGRSPVPCRAAVAASAAGALVAFAPLACCARVATVAGRVVEEQLALDLAQQLVAGQHIPAPARNIARI